MNLDFQNQTKEFDNFSQIFKEKQKKKKIAQ